MAHKDQQWVLEEKAFCEKILDNFIQITDDEANLTVLNLKKMIKDRLLEPFNVIISLQSFTENQLELAQTQVNVISFNVKQMQDKIFKLQAENEVLKEKLKKYNDIEIACEEV